MQILGAAGKSGSGRTTLTHYIARILVDRDYGLPRLTTMEHLEAAVRKAQDDEFHGLDRAEVILLVDDVSYPQDVELIHQWGGKVVFVCADGRLTNLKAKWRQTKAERMANEYSSGVSSELFDFVITNHHSIELFEAEIERSLPILLGGDASYEAGLI